MRKLKDQRLQRLLDEISDNDFSKQLNEHLQNISGSTGMSEADHRVYFGSLPGKREIVNRFSVLFFAHEIEEIKDFDPHGWNSLPTEPPCDTALRIETVDDDYFAGEMQESGLWIDYEGRRISPEKIKRFALWDPDAKEENGVVRRAALAAYRKIRDHAEEK